MSSKGDKYLEIVVCVKSEKEEKRVSLTAKTPLFVGVVNRLCEFSGNNIVR